MFPVVASSKVEALDPVSRKDDVPMTPNLLTDSPITPLLHGDVVKPLNGFSALKLGHPFKGSLKKSRQTAFVAPSFQDNESMKASVHDVEGPDPIQPEKRSIKWLDNHGKELIEVKEFEPSECEDSDDEQEYLFGSCTCVIQ